MNFVAIIVLSAAFLFAAMLIGYEIGWRFGKARLAHEQEMEPKGVGAAVAGVFGVLGLIVAFSFHGAASRFEARRHLITEEANAIRTVYLRLDLLPGGVQSELKDRFRAYVDLRAATYSRAGDHAATERQLAECAALQSEIWKTTTDACLSQGTPVATSMLLSALNEMINVTTTREMATRGHPPLAVYLLLVSLCIASTFLMGYDTSINRRRNWTYIVAFAAVMCFALYITADLEFPRRGLIRVDKASKVLVELREKMD